MNMRRHKINNELFEKLMRERGYVINRYNAWESTGKTNSNVHRDFVECIEQSIECVEATESAEGEVHKL